MHIEKYRQILPFLVATTDRKRPVTARAIFILHRDEDDSDAHDKTAAARPRVETSRWSVFRTGRRTHRHDSCSLYLDRSCRFYKKIA